MLRVTSDSFVTVNNQGKKFLCLNGSQGVTLILFKVDKCPGCAETLPHFISLAKAGYGNVKYGICDVTADRRVLKKSQDTTTEIKGVPHLILFNAERPFSVLKGSKDMSSLKNFIATSLTKLKQRIQNEPPQKKYWTPELRDVPSNIKNSPNEDEDSDDNKFLTPEGVTPYNTPWQSEYSKLVDLEKRNQ